MNDPSYVVVKGYQTEHQQFWSGKHWVSEYPDAQKMTSVAAFRWSRSSDYQDDPTVCVVENYGLETEKVAL